MYPAADMLGEREDCVLCAVSLELKLCLACGHLKKTDIILYDWQTQSSIILPLCKIIKMGI